jgi:hypothetical protein
MCRRDDVPSGRFALGAQLQRRERLLNGDVRNLLP